jgi:hypothetical protein
MAPADGLLGQPAPPLTFCLAEQGAQYLVYSDHGTPFFLDTHHDPAGAANYNITWFDPVSGASHAGGVAKPGVLHLTPPSAGRHWVAVLLGGARWDSALAVAAQPNMPAAALVLYAHLNARLQTT